MLLLLSGGNVAPISALTLRKPVVDGLGFVGIMEPSGASFAKRRNRIFLRAGAR
jgi:hypothetical protein